jgi:hypothetical protein
MSSYKSLQNYNDRSAPGVMVVPAPKGSYHQIIPSYNAIGYDALTHGVPPSGVNYFSVKNAYSCDVEPAYNKRAC